MASSHMSNTQSMQILYDDIIERVARSFQAHAVVNGTNFVHFDQFEQVSIKIVSIFDLGPFMHLLGGRCCILADFCTAALARQDSTTAKGEDLIWDDSD